jgi:hypothetical protein
MEKSTVFLSLPRNVLLGGGGLNSLSKADILLQVSKKSIEAGRGMEKIQGCPAMSRKHGSILGRKVQLLPNASLGRERRD